jgi:tRNA (guanine37-N1)-methyltransferase
MKCTVLTLFPEMVENIAYTSILGRAVKNGVIDFSAVYIRDFADNDRGQIDDYTYGGGAGLMIQAEPVYRAHQHVTGGRPVRTVFLTPSGVPFTQSLARELAKEEELVFLCGHYEGIDERVLEEVVTDRVSIGDYVLTGGELPAMVMIDAISRLIPGVLGNETSADIESFHRNLLEYPQFTRPEVWHDKAIPEVLLTGDHRKIEAWRTTHAEERTKKYRPDLFEKYQKECELFDRLSRKKRRNMPATEAMRLHDIRILKQTEDDLCFLDLEENILYFCALNDTVTNVHLPEELPAGIIELRGCGVKADEIPEGWSEREERLFVFTEKSPLSGATYEKDALKKEYMDRTNAKVMGFQVPWEGIPAEKTEIIALLEQLRYYEADRCLYRYVR